MKPTRRIILVLILVFATCFVTEFYCGNNRLGLIIHLKNCDYPDGLEGISIVRRQRLYEYLLNGETYAAGEFVLDKKYINDWLLDTDFEVISYVAKRTNERKFFTDIKKVPEEILAGNISFHFQILHKNGERTVIEVDATKKPLLVRLRYCVT